MRASSFRVFATTVCLWLAATAAIPAHAAPPVSADITARLAGFDGDVQQMLRDWNGAGLGVGIVVGDQLVFAQGYGYRDYGQKLPFTSRTLFQIASNTKLFTAVTAGFLVEQGALNWDAPVRQAVPTLRFYNDDLDRTVTLRDMLSHRTGIPGYNTIWYKGDFSNEQLFERIRYLEPTAPLRQTYLYNNLMYAAVGNIIAQKTGKPWAEYVREKILDPLQMRSTAVLSVAEMRTQPDHGVPYTERPNSAELYAQPYNESTGGIAAAGGIVSNIDDLSHWLIALMNDGHYEGRQVLPPAVLKETLRPAIPVPKYANYAAIKSYEARGWREFLNPTYGMGRQTVVYRGHFVAYHDGGLRGFRSKVSYLPAERFGVIVFALGDHIQMLTDSITYNVYERLLDLDLTPWSARLLEIRLKDKQASNEARSHAGEDRVRNTKPSHPLADYVGEYEHPAYGILRIGQTGGQLQFNLGHIRAAMSHYHYDRFDTLGNEQVRNSKYAVNFSTNPSGDIDRATLSLDQAEVTFVRRPDYLEPLQLERLLGVYIDPTGREQRVLVQPDGSLAVQQAGGSTTVLLPYRGLRFRVKDFSDIVYEFVEEQGRIIALKRTAPAGVSISPRE